MERSGDGLQFEELCSISSKGNGNTKNVYTYNDYVPFAGKIYYRLTAVDLDGSKEIFEIISAQCQEAKQVRVWPNPSPDGHFSVMYNFQPQEAVRVIVTDLNGTEIQRLSDMKPKKDFTLSSPGTYVIVVEANEFKYAERVIAR